MAQNDMREFMCHYPSDLRFIVGGLHETRMHEGGTTGQGERINALVVDHGEAKRKPGFLRWSLCGKALADAVDVVLELPVIDDLQLLAHLGGSLLTKLHILFSGEE